MALSQWLPRSRRGDGVYDTPNLTVPVGVDIVNVKLDVAPADFATPDLSVTLTVQESSDNGAVWNTQMQVVWHGGPEPYNRDRTIAIGWVASVNGISVFAGNLVRVHFLTVGTFRWGLEGELI